MIWGALWGGLWGYDGSFDPGAQGVVENAKDDTVFFGSSDVGSFSDLAVDLGQHGDDLTDSTTYIEQDSERWELAPPFAIEIVCHMTDPTTVDQSGYLYDFGTGGNRQSIRLSTAGRATLDINNAQVGQTSSPNVTGPSIICWSCEPNPLATGASDAYRSELRTIQTAESDLFLKTVMLHALPAYAGGGDVASIGADTSGANAPPCTITRVRMSQGRFHSSTETREDFSTRTPAPTLDGIVPIEYPVFDKASTLTEDGNLAGPTFAQAIAASKANGYRTLCPLVNTRTLSQYGIPGSDLVDPNIPFYRGAPGASDYKLMLQWTFKRPVPLSVDYVSARVCVELDADSGGSLPMSLHVRAYSMNRPPAITGQVQSNTNVPAPPSLDYRFCGDTVTESVADTPTHQWVDLGTMQVVRDSNGFSYFMIACDASDFANSAGDVFRILSFHIEPLPSAQTTDTAIGGLGGLE